MNVSKEQIIEVLKTIRDPEIHVDIWTLGLIYNLEVTENEVKILMTYTTPFCPWGPQLQQEITDSITKVLGVKKVDIEITFDPPYQLPPEMRATLGI